MGRRSLTTTAGRSSELAPRCRRSYNSRSNEESVDTVGYYFGAWLGVALAVVGFCVWMSTPRGKVDDD